MNPDRFVKVFDLLDVGRDWTFLAVGLIFVVIGIVVAAFPTIVKATGIPFFNFTTRPRKFFRYGFLLFAILWTAVTFSITYSQYSRHKRLVQSGSCRVVQGPIEHFVPMPDGGHAQESFSVSGIVFRYSDFIITGGFNNTSSHGGPINSGSYVRICYDPSDNAILRLEIRDLKGETKNYANSTSIFPPSSDMRRANGESPIAPLWYSSLISVLFFRPGCHPDDVSALSANVFPHQDRSCRRVPYLRWTPTRQEGQASKQHDLLGEGKSYNLAAAERVQFPANPANDCQAPCRRPR